MKHLLTSLLLLFALLANLSAQEAVPAALPPLVLGQTVDFLDNSFFGVPEGEDYYTPALLRASVQRAYDAGFRRIYFRDGGGGISYYPSKVRPLYKGSHWKKQADQLNKTVRTYDPLAEYIKVCHELGMELYYWTPIYDQGSETFQYFPGTKQYELFGRFPNRNMTLKPEHCMAHRFANRPIEKLAGTIGRIEIYADNVPVYAEGDFEIYVADHNQDFVRYDKPFSVDVTKKEPYGAVMTISGLEIDKPVIKFYGKKDTGLYVTVQTAEGRSAQAFYQDGTPVAIFSSCEVTNTTSYTEGANVAELQRHGCGFDKGFAWGKNGESFFLRIGDFERYALGMPDYVFMENREYIRAIVTELYERYPNLDGLCFSMRVHNWPCSGPRKEIQAQGLAYGYSQPIVEEYKKRYGVDITTEEFDLEALQKLRGESLTRLLAEVAPIVHAHGSKLECMAPVRNALPYAHGNNYCWWDTANIDNFFDIREWAQKGYVDAVLMLGSGHLQKGALTKEIKEEIEAFHAKLIGTDTRLEFHYLITDALKDEGTRQFFSELIAHPLLDGVECYETNGMERVNNFPECTAIVDKCPRTIR